MKRSIRLLATLFVFASASFIRADEFKSETILSTTTFGPIHVQGNQFMLIRNFTQDGAFSADQGFVTVTKPPGTGTPVIVLTAANLSPPTDVINNVIIAGPADVMVMCGTPGNCFISYKKGDNN
ncbi:MAG TPA: hypothetical protein VNX27_09815 [Chthoniobacterales bacterium]|jgi:hypothetical protein|nr:hypothetical protein [Chthoniobacterales bacterium]